MFIKTAGAEAIAETSSGRSVAVICKCPYCGEAIKLLMPTRSLEALMQAASQQKCERCSKEFMLAKIDKDILRVKARDYQMPGHED